MRQDVIVVHPGDAAGPAEWHLGAGAIVTARDGRAVAAVDSQSVNETDAPAAAAKLQPKG